MTPEWLLDNIKVEQQIADANYVDAVKSYVAAVQDWIMVNSARRDNGIPLTTFTKPIPRRIVYFPVEGEFRMDQRLEDPDNSLPAPSLPPPVAVPPKVSFSTSAATFDTTLLNMLSAILSDLAKIKAAVVR